MTKEDPIDEYRGEVLPDRFIFRINDAHLVQRSLPAGDYIINVNTIIGIVEFIRRKP